MRDSRLCFLRNSSRILITTSRLENAHGRILSIARSCSSSISVTKPWRIGLIEAKVKTTIAPSDLCIVSERVRVVFSHELRTILKMSKYIGLDWLVPGSCCEYNFGSFQYRCKPCQWFRLKVSFRDCWLSEGERVGIEYDELRNI
jgi:hypothetical protein